MQTRQVPLYQKNVKCQKCVWICLIFTHFLNLEGRDLKSEIRFIPDEVYFDGEC